MPLLGWYIFIHNWPMTVVEMMTGMKYTFRKRPSNLTPREMTSAKPSASGTWTKMERPANMAELTMPLTK